MSHLDPVISDPPTDDELARKLTMAVDAIDELAPEVVRSPEDTDALIDRRVREVGNARRSDEEIMDSATIYDEAEGTENDEQAESPALVRAMALQAVYDAGHFDGDESLEDATERIERYVGRVRDDAPDTASKIEALIGQFPERLLERDHGDGLRVRCTDEGKARFLSPVDEDDEISENTGGFEHAELMRAAYDDMLAVGLPLHVVRQGGDDDPDAIAEPESAELRSARPPSSPRKWSPSSRNSARRTRSSTGLPTPGLSTSKPSTVPATLLPASRWSTSPGRSRTAAA